MDQNAFDIGYYGIFSSYVTVWDSSRRNTPDVTVDVMRLGINAKKNTLGARFEGQIRPDNGVQVRAAHVLLSLPKDFSFQLGRVRPGGAYGYGTFWNNTPGGFAATDGFLISKAHKIDANFTAQYAATYGNTFSIPVANQRTVPGYQIGSGSPTQGRLMVGSVSTTYKKLDAAVYYGYQNDQLALATDEKASPPVRSQVAHVSSLESSLGYRPHESLSLGGHYTQKITGRLRSVTLKGNSVTEEEFVEGSAVIKDFTWGLGINGDTKRMGLKDLIQSGDMFTYAVGYDRVSRRTKGKSQEHLKDPHQFAAQFGYNLNGTLEIFLAGGHQWAKAKVFPNSRGVSGARYSSEFVSLNSLLIF